MMERTKTVSVSLRAIIVLILAWLPVLSSCSKDDPVLDDSKDGDVVVLQTATEGKGIDLVLMGDGFTKKQIQSGSYREAMESTMEYFFTEEPMASFRHLFNVYYVVGVSKDGNCNEGSTTCFGAKHASGSHIEGNRYQVEKYAAYALDEEAMGYCTIVVVMNDSGTGGTSFMSSSRKDDWGGGRSLCFVPYLGGRDMCRKILLHEAAGHGLAKLGDEYAYESYGSATYAFIEKVNTLSQYGFYRNLDTERSSDKVKWSRFISDERYASERIAVYQGGGTWWDGIYRPTSNSIMGSYEDKDKFNAPSREAIYITMHKLAFGDSWEYDYEKFVEYDAINRK